MRPSLMATAETRWYLASEGRTFGPYRRDQLEKFVEGGQVTGDSKVSLVGTTAWVPLAQALPHLFADAPPPPLPKGSTAPPRTPVRRPVRDARPIVVAAKSYVPWAILVLVLYWVGFWLIGAVTNWVFYLQAKADHRATGSAPEGEGCLRALLIVLFWIPLVIAAVVFMFTVVAGARVTGHHW